MEPGGRGSHTEGRGKLVAGGGSHVTASRGLVCLWKGVLGREGLELKGGWRCGSPGCWGGGGVSWRRILSGSQAWSSLML